MTSTACSICRRHSATLDVKNGTHLQSSENQKVLRKSSDQIMGLCLVRLAGMFGTQQAKRLQESGSKTLSIWLSTHSQCQQSVLWTKYLDSMHGNITAPYHPGFYTQYRSYDDVVKAYDKLTDEVKNSEQGRILPLKSRI